jgi:DNA-binding PucR family transcriptional regulator
MTEKEKDLLKAYATCDMSGLKTAMLLHVHHNTVNYRMYRIQEKYGIDPRSFYGLVKLLEMAGGNNGKAN